MSPRETPVEINSWKEIAAYLDVSVRTAQKMEKTQGLPVKRFPGERGRVSADPVEINRWRAATLEQSKVWTRIHFLRWYAAAATTVLACALSFAGVQYAHNRSRGSPAITRVEAQALIVLDGRGRELWRYVMPVPVLASTYDPAVSHRMWIGDLDGRPGSETLFLYWPVSRERTGTTLICFSETGEEMWRFAPGRQISDRTQTYSPVYLAERVVVTGPVAVRRVIVTSHHLAQYPNQVAILDSHGKLLEEYWHSGHLPQIDVGDLDQDGRDEILLGGTNNDLGATLVVLEPGRSGGASRQPEGSRHQLQDIRPASERARLVFPRTCINRALLEYNRAASVALSGGEIKADIQEAGDQAPNAGVIYTFDRNLRLKQAVVSDAFRALHRQLRVAGTIDHDLSERETQELREVQFTGR